MRTGLLVVAFLWGSAALAQPAPQADKASPPAVQAEERTAAAGASVVRERPDRDEAQRLFRELDRNGDGYLSDDELWGRRGENANWAASDRNRDGRISPDEFTVLRR